MPPSANPKTRKKRETILKGWRRMENKGSRTVKSFSEMWESVLQISLILLVRHFRVSKKKLWIDEAVFIAQRAVNGQIPVIHLQFWAYYMGPGTDCFPHQWVQRKLMSPEHYFSRQVCNTIASWDSLKWKLCNPETKFCAKDAGCAGKKITGYTHSPESSLLAYTKRGKARPKK